MSVIHGYSTMGGIEYDDGDCVEKKKKRERPKKIYKSQRWPSSNALGLHEQASWMHTHLVSFVELSYIYSSSASVAWQSLLTHIDIY